MKEFLTNQLNSLGFAWWVKIATEQPNCTYYFGPFLSQTEATAAMQGYIDDLENEGAADISSQVSRCKPNNLTIYDERLDFIESDRTPVLSS